MLKIPIDPKYSIIVEPGLVGMSVQIVNMSGDAIPESEPLFLLRARDRLAVATLEAYRVLAIRDGCTDFHLKGIDERLAEFREFAGKHPDRMKQPGITRGR